MSEVFAVIAESHNSDTEVELFLTFEKAVDWAQKWVEDNQMDGYDWRRSYGPWSRPSNWLYFHCCSPEGDTIRIERKAVKP